MADSLPSEQTGRVIPPLITLSFAVLAISSAPIFIRISEADIGANATVYDRLFIFAVVFGSVRLIQRIQTPVVPSDPVQTDAPTPWILLSSIGIVTVITMVLWAISLEYTSVAKSMLLNNLTPVFTTIGSWLVFGKRFDRRFLTGMVIALTGAVVLGFEDLSGDEGGLLGDCYAVLSSIFLGTYILMAEHLRPHFSGTTILLWRCSVGSLLLLPLVLVTEGRLFPSTPLAWVAVIGLGLICEGTGQRLIASCMGEFSSSFVSLFLLLEPIVSAILAWLVFTEELSPLCLVGFGVVLSGIYLANTSPACSQHGYGSVDPLPRTDPRATDPRTLEVY